MAVHDDTALGDSFDALPLRVDELDVGSIERVKVFVVKAGGAYRIGGSRA